MTNVKKSTQYKREHKADYGREKIEILYRDEWLCVINKPSGLLSVPYPGSKVRTAQGLLEEILRKQGLVHGGRSGGHGGYRPFVVHRLDRDTSGVMMFALTEPAQKKIMDTWQTMVTDRLYRAVAENPGLGRQRGADVAGRDSPKGAGRGDDRRAGAGRGMKGGEGGHPDRLDFSPLPDSGLIDDPLAKNAHNVGFVPKPGDLDKNGRPFQTIAARTHYKVVKRGPTHTLFELSLDTGKKNQIRAHLAAHGYPLAGDEDHRAHTDHFHRLCLHARTLAFVHPFTGEKMAFEVPEPEDWVQYVENGDFKPEPVLWEKDAPGNHIGYGNKKGAGGRNLHNQNGPEDEVERVMKNHKSGRAKAHMDFIERGKNFRK